MKKQYEWLTKANGLDMIVAGLHAHQMAERRYRNMEEGFSRIDEITDFYLSNLEGLRLWAKFGLTIEKYRSLELLESPCIL